MDCRFDCRASFVEKVDVDVMVDLLCTCSANGAAECGVDLAMELCCVAQEFANEAVSMNKKRRGVGEWK